MELIRDLPSSLSDFADLLAESVSDGLFTRVEYDLVDDEHVIDIYDGTNVVCRIMDSISRSSRQFIPFVDSSHSKDDYVANTPWIYRAEWFKMGTYYNPCMLRCHGGLVLLDQVACLYDTYINYGASFIIIGRTSDSKTGFIVSSNDGAGWVPQEIRAENIAVTTYGDSLSATSRYYMPKMNYSGEKSTEYAQEGSIAAKAYNRDRTILTRVPVPGQYNSDGYFTSVFFRSMDAFDGPGTHIINGRKYGVLGNWAVLDE